MFFRDDFAFLSNMFPCEIVYKDLHFQSSESLYQAAKCKDKSLIPNFCNLDGYRAKKLGRKVQLIDNWEQIKIDVMRKCVYLKFTQNPILLQRLKKVKGLISEENTWNDTFWGICNREGENHLGKILMEFRDSLEG